MLEEPPHDYVVRGPGVRPAEPVRYEVARAYGERAASVRPDVPLRAYSTAAYAEARQEYAAGAYPRCAARSSGGRS